MQVRLRSRVTGNYQHMHDRKNLYRRCDRLSENRAPTVTARDVGVDLDRVNSLQFVDEFHALCYFLKRIVQYLCIKVINYFGNKSLCGKVFLKENLNLFSSLEEI